MRPEGRAGRIAARYAALVGIVVLVGFPVYVYVEPPSRALIARLGAALVLGLALLELRQVLIHRLAPSDDSALDAARHRVAPAAEIPHRFLDLVGDVRATLRSRRHFEQAFWPRLTALTSRPLVPPPVRLGRGPSLASLRDVIARAEEPS